MVEAKSRQDQLEAVEPEIQEAPTALFETECIEYCQLFKPLHCR